MAPFPSDSPILSLVHEHLELVIAFHWSSQTVSVALGFNQADTDIKVQVFIWFSDWKNQITCGLDSNICGHFPETEGSVSIFHVAVATVEWFALLLSEMLDFA